MLALLPTQATINLPNGFMKDGIIIRSSNLDLTGGGRTQINLLNDVGDIILHVGFRPDRNEIVFNTRRGSSWENERQITFQGRFEGSSPTLAIFDHGDRFQIFLDSATIFNFMKRFHDRPTALAYIVDPDQRSLFSPSLIVDSHISIAGLLPRKN